MNTLALLTLLLFSGLVFQTTVLWFAVHTCQLDRTTGWRAARVVVIRGLVASGLFAVMLAADGEREWLAIAGLILVDALVTFWLIGRVFGGARPKQARAWLLNLAAGSVAGVVFAFIFARCFDEFAWVNSSMTPNIRGYHVVETLPDGNHLIHAANFPGDVRGVPPGDPSGAIVAETYEYREVPRPTVHTHSADRVLCNKTKFPERWDAAVVNFKNEPDFNSVKRLVGLPGERIQIRDGSVWVNGARLTPPVRLGPIHYEAFEFMANEVVLGSDEYFVLGDNSNRSLDSQIRGPVTRDQIAGVADLIYWPPARWRIRP